jgi:hypothetical protein
MHVQWYCPPAVGYTLASSAKVKAQAPTSTSMMMGPYIKMTGPPWEIARAKVAAMPAQLLLMIKPAETISIADMFRASSGRDQRGGERDPVFGPHVWWFLLGRLVSKWCTSKDSKRLAPLDIRRGLRFLHFAHFRCRFHRVVRDSWRIQSNLGQH